MYSPERVLVTHEMRESLPALLGAHVLHVLRGDVECTGGLLWFVWPKGVGCSAKIAQGHWPLA